VKGYVYSDLDDNLFVLLASYIDEVDPGYWSRNHASINSVWKFDTEDDEVMTRLLASISRHEFPQHKVLLLCSAMNFDLAAFIDRVRARSQPNNPIPVEPDGE
jgi:hypothetical protein